VCGGRWRFPSGLQIVLSVLVSGVCVNGRERLRQLQRERGCVCVCKCVREVPEWLADRAERLGFRCVCERERETATVTERARICMCTCVCVCQREVPQ